jgi:hypothetical protein
MTTYNRVHQDLIGLRAVGALRLDQSLSRSEANSLDECASSNCDG